MLPTTPNRISSGIAGLDELLNRGLIEQRCYLVRGAPGQGKTTLGLHFLADTNTDGSSLFIGFQEPEEQLHANAASVGLDVSSINFLSLAPDESFFTEQQSYDVFSASDVEQEPLTGSVIETIERIKPKRVFVDSLTQLRFLSADIYQYRKQVLSFLRFLTHRGATVLFSSESTEHLPDDDLQFLADGVINLEPAESSSTIAVRKYRGSRFIPGRHQYRLDENGFHVFPRLRPPEARLVEAAPGQLGSGSKELDNMLHGGLEAGTVTLITGPTGIGKTTLAGGFAIEAARQGNRAAIYMFEEELNTFLWRMRALELDVDPPYRNGNLVLEQVEPMRYMADEFMALVRQQTEKESVKLVILDSITGLDLALESTEEVGRPLHALTKTLARMGISVILVNENEVTTGEIRVSQRDISYLADNVIYLRYVQPDESLQKVIGVLKKRLSGYENELREFKIAPGGVWLNSVSAEIKDSVSVGVGSNGPS